MRYRSRRAPPGGESGSGIELMDRDGLLRKDASTMMRGITSRSAALILDGVKSPLTGDALELMLTSVCKVEA
jgi:hypothetical protein